MSAPASASSAPPPSSLPINTDKGALTMLVKPASPGADLAALAAHAATTQGPALVVKL